MSSEEPYKIAALNVLANLIASTGTPQLPAPAAQPGAEEKISEVEEAETKDTDMEAENSGTAATAEAENRKEVFNRVGKCTGRDTGMEVVFDALKSPSEQVRAAAYNVCGALAAEASGWGVKALVGHSGFLERLVDKSTDTTSEGAKWRFLIAKFLYNNPQGRRLLCKCGLPCISSIIRSSLPGFRLCFVVFCSGILHRNPQQFLEVQQKSLWLCINPNRCINNIP